ncbi:MAG: DNA alkylation repair protein [Vicinamibacterales bacterium]
MAARPTSSTSSSEVRSVEAVLAWLSRRGRRRNVEGMARYGIVTPKAFGVSMATMAPLVRRLGRDHALAEALWRTGWLEARVLAGFVVDPARLTPRLMDAWARDFDHWAVTDSTCLHAFRRAAGAWGRVRAWSRRRGEFQRRAAFALLAGLAVHDTRAPDARFLATFPDVRRAAEDDRPSVKKSVNWALRQIGKRNEALRHAVLECLDVIDALDTPGARWIAGDARRELTSPAVRARLAARASRSPRGGPR